MAIAFLIIIAVIFYLSVLVTMLRYFVKMKRLTDVDKKLRQTDKSTFAIIIEQVITLLAVIVFYAVEMNGIEVAVDKALAISFSILFAVGIILTICVDKFYMRKQFANYGKRRVETEQDQKINILSRDTLKVGIAVCMMNLLFNLMLFGAVAYFVR